MLLKLNKNHKKDKKDEIQKERRNFLKKSEYTVSTLMVLGQLAWPSTAKSDIGGSLPPGGPAWWEN